MNKKIARVLLVGCSLIPLQASFAAPGTPHSDEWFEGRISGALDYNSFLNSSDIDVDSDGSQVTLSGTVGSPVERTLAEDIARSIDGVSNVKNEIEVDPAMKYEDRSSFAQQIDDATTTAAIKSKLLSNKGTHGFDINVDTKNNVVTLRGEVSTAQEKQLAERIAYQTRGVREVQNNLTLGTSKDAMTRHQTAKSKDMATGVSDAWISTKARTVLLFSSEYPGSDVDVTTTNGRVTLKGVARSPEQKAEIAREIKELVGVQEVNNQLVVRKGGA